MNIFDAKMLDTLAAFLSAQPPATYNGRDIYRQYTHDRVTAGDFRIIGRSTAYMIIEMLGYRRDRLHNSSATFTLDQPRQPTDTLRRWAQDNTGRPGYRPPRHP